MTRRLSFVVTCLAVGLLGGEMASAATGDLINQTLAGRHGMTRAWFAQAQMDPGRGQITHLVLREGILFVQTSQAMVQALDAETGQQLWAVQVGKPGYPDMPVDASGDYVAVINGSTLYILNRYDGKLLWEKPLEGSPGAGPGLSDQQVYIPLIDGLVYTYPLKPVARPVLEIEGEMDSKPAGSADKPAATPGKVAATSGLPNQPGAKGGKSAAGAQKTGATAGGTDKTANGSTPASSPEEEQQRRASLRLTQDIVPGLVCPSVGQAFTRPLVTTRATGEENVVWTTSAGYLFLGRLFENHFSTLYRLSTEGPMSTEPTYLPPDPHIAADSGVIFGTSEDGFVYAIREKDGKLIWRFSTGEPLVQRSAVVGSRIYVPTQTEGMYCLDAAKGEQLWCTPGIRRFIAASRDRVYVIDNVGQMVVLNAQTGTRVDGFDISRLPIRMTNDTNDRIYLATPSGLVQCLHEIDAPQPIHHRELREQRQAQEAEKRAAEDEAAKKQGAAAAAAAPSNEPPSFFAEPEAPPAKEAQPRKTTVAPKEKAAQPPKKQATPNKKAAKADAKAPAPDDNPFN